VDNLGPGPILLFDGVCNFCSGTVSFVIRRDPRAQFRFAALQSDAGRTLLEHHGLSQNEFDTAVVVRDGRAYTKSDAALEVVRHLRTPWSWLFVLRIVPKPIRNFIYDRVAKHRYSLFGRKDECLIPSPDVRQRFL
jgi:predicted DCC family thiol-disulfide oxidoreductase YuxK